MSKPDDRLLQFARWMRREPTPAERILWQLVRNRRLAGYRFRRQDKFAPYIIDLYCAVAKLVVELDGDTHVGREEYDARRDEVLQAHGLLVLRIPNGLVYDDPEGVVELIARTCAERAAANPKVAHKVDAVGRFQSKPKG